jgi:fermentation-respiration switch protein FrsA (DUF1100 family)
MAHGFSAVREQMLDAYAERFMQTGMAVLLFDYRHFGKSSGEPRQLLSIRRQLQDWQAAVAAARSLPEIDPSRIALFGTSFSGGHVQAIAARDHQIAATIAQVPWCDGLGNLPALGFDHVVRLTMAGLKDIAKTMIGGPSFHIAVVGEPGSLAAIATPDAVEGFARITPPNSNWRNEVCARIALTVGFYRPGVGASKIRCPIMYCIGEQDIVTPARFAHQAAHRAPLSEINTYDCGHFDLYVSPLWEKAVSDQIEFLTRHLS